MKRYRIDIFLSDGREIWSRVVASDQADAIDRLSQQKKVVDFIGTAKISKITASVEPGNVEAIPDSKKFILQKSKTDNYYIATDTATNFVIKFEKNNYNETARVTDIDGTLTDPLQAATIIRELSEWLALYHADLV